MWYGDIHGLGHILAVHRFRPQFGPRYLKLDRRVSATRSCRNMGSVRPGFRHVSLFSDYFSDIEFIISPGRAMAIKWKETSTYIAATPSARKLRLLGSLSNHHACQNRQTGPPTMSGPLVIWTTPTDHQGSCCRALYAHERHHSVQNHGSLRHRNYT